MRTIAALALILAACGTDPQGDDTNVDAVHQPVTMDVTCQDFTREARTAGVLRERITYRYGLVDSVGPETAFSVELCGQATIPADAQPCPSGATCTGSLSPPGRVCQRYYRSGAFYDGKLRVSCGYLFDRFDDRGVLTSQQGLSYSSVRVTVY